MQIEEAHDKACAIYNKAYWLVNQFLASHMETNEEQGGYLAVYTDSGSLLLISLIGAPPLSKRHQFYTNAVEKATRLADNKIMLTSFQNANTDEGQHGGGIKINDFIISFSGLPAKGDEWVTTMAAYQEKLLSKNDIAIIADISNNQFLIKELETL